MLSHLDLIKEILDGHWFASNSPFQAQFQEGHPQLTIITGPNASGKSLLRKVIQSRHQYDYEFEIIHVSQAGRCESGGLKRVFIYGNEQDESTGFNSAKTLLTAIRTGQSRTNPFTLLLDEPEIGCGEEVQAALGERLARDLHTMPNMHGCFIITHSRQFAKHLLHLNPSHLRLSHDNFTLPQWIDREIVPAQLEELQEFGRQRWHAVQNIINERKKSDKA